MTVIADTHVHLYPCHDAGALLRAGWDHLTANLSAEERSTAHRVLCLTERHDCRAFAAIDQGQLLPAPFTVSGRGEGWLHLDDAEGRTLTLVAGRQINTAERIEILALGADLDLPDGAPIRDVIPRVRSSGAVPVIAWAPGKWFFQRGKTVAALVADARAGDFLLGDSTLRPRGWPRPTLMGWAAGRGIGTVCGSDPLPFAGEEPRAGTYAVRWDGAWDSARPGDSLRALLAAPPEALQPAGCRNDPLTMARRLKGNRDSRKREVRS